MLPDNVKFNTVFGRIDLIPTFKIEGNRILAGGYSVHYDERGNKIKQTEPEYYSSINLGE